MEVIVSFHCRAPAARRNISKHLRSAFKWIRIRICTAAAATLLNYVPCWLPPGPGSPGFQDFRIPGPGLLPPSIHVNYFGRLSERVELTSQL